MDERKIVNNIVEEARQKAQQNGGSEFAYICGVLEVYLEEAISAIDKRDAKWFYNQMKGYDK